MSCNDELLYHHGIKGMRWGIRRFQNKDGTLTLLGKKRDRANRDDDGKKEPKTKEKPKSTRELSDSELKSKIDRLNLERQALSLEKEVARLDPKSVSKGESFIKRLGNEVLAPAAINAGREQLTKLLNKTLNEALGLNSEDSIGALKKSVETLNLKKQKKELEDFFNRDDSLKKSVDELNLKKQKKELEDFFNRDDSLKKSVDELNLQKQKRDLEKALSGKTDPDEELEKLAKRLRNEETIRRLKAKD